MKLFPILIPSTENKERLIGINKFIDNSLDNGLNITENIKKDSIYRLTIMHGPKICNFNCPDYCCTEGLSKRNLDKGQLKEIIDQASSLGVQVTYWPGLGELTLLNDFWDIQKHIKEKGMKSVVFTNGSVFWNDTLAEKYTGNNSSKLIEKVRNLNIYFYVKYWNSNPDKAAKMSGVKPEEYPFIEFRGRIIPLALYNLIQSIPKERLGVEVMISKENYGDAIKNILPAIEDLDIYSYIEPVIFSGKAEGKQKELSLSAKEYYKLSNIFASGGSYCEKRQSIELILVGDSLSPGIVIPPRKEDKVIDCNGKVRNIFEIFHNNYFRQVRKVSDSLNGCLCRAVWNGEVKL